MAGCLMHVGGNELMININNNKRKNREHKLQKITKFSFKRYEMIS